MNPLAKALRQAIASLGCVVREFTELAYQYTPQAVYFKLHEDLYPTISEDPEAIELSVTESDVWAYILDNHKVDTAVDLCRLPESLQSDLQAAIIKAFKAADKDTDRLYTDVQPVVAELCTDCSEFVTECDAETPEGMAELIIEWWDIADAIKYIEEIWIQTLDSWERTFDPDDLESDSDLQDAIGNLYNTDYDDCREVVTEGCYESISMFTNYWEPDTMDRDIAEKCGLTAFTFRNATTDQTYELLALGGYGMDLSPKLDAYQALVHKSVPENSLICGRHADPEYARSLLGDDVMSEVLEAVTLEFPAFKLSLDAAAAKLEVTEEIMFIGDTDTNIYATDSVYDSGCCFRGDRNECTLCDFDVNFCPKTKDIEDPETGRVEFITYIPEKCPLRKGPAFVYGREPK